MTSLAAAPSVPSRRLTGLPAAAAVLGEDLASTLAYAALYACTHSLLISLAVGLAAGAGAIAWRLARGRQVDAMQWMSLALVCVFGGLGLWLHDPRFVMVKPTIAYLAVAAVMLKPGWMARYMPAVVQAHGRDLVRGFEGVWAASMLAIAVANLALALRGDTAAWTAFLAVVPLGAKLALTATQYATLRVLVRRRVRGARAALAAQAGA